MQADLNCPLPLEGNRWMLRRASARWWEGRLPFDSPGERWEVREAMVGYLCAWSWQELTVGDSYQSSHDEQGSKEC